MDDDDEDQLTADERRSVLAWGTGVTVLVPPTTLVGLLAGAVAARPDATAVVGGGEQLTSAELWDAAGELAGRLRAAGARPGRAVGVAVPRTPLMVVALLAVLRSGAHYVPLDTALPAARLRLILADAAPVACVVAPQTRDRLPVSDVTIIDGTAHDGSSSVAPDDDAAAPDDLAYVMFTSGSTGRPKGVCVEHRSAVDLVVTSAHAYDAGPQDRMLSYASVGFDISVAEIFTALAVGATLVVADDADRMSPDRLHALLVAERLTIAEVPPSLLALLDPYALPDLRLMVVGGEAPPAPQIARWVAAGHRVINAYGPTETTVTATWMSCTDELLAAVPIGRPIANHRAYVLDERQRLVAPGVPGELWIGGPGVARGYLGAPELTAERFRPDPVTGVAEARTYRTGDRVSWNADGTLAFLGRVDGQLTVRGHRIEPGDVEARLRAHPDVRTAAVGTTVIAGATQLVGYVVATDRPAPGARELADWCARELPAAFVPSTFVVLDAVPLDGNGKVDRAALPAPVFDVDGPGDAPRTDTESRLLAMWRELLPGVRIGVHDDFLTAGGHSLVAMRLLVRIRQAFGVELTPHTLHTAATVAALAAEVELAAEIEAADPVPLSPADPTVAVGTLSHAQRQLWFVERLDPGRATWNLPLGLRLHGPLDPDVLRAALGDVVARHTVLRSAIVLDGDQPRSIDAGTTAAAALPLVVDDLRGLPAEDRDSVLADRARADATTPLPLAVAPLWRARLTRLGDDEWAFVIVVHHIVADGWSLSVLLDELGTAYTARLTGTAPGLPPTTGGYADFVRRQEADLRGARLDRRLDFWRSTLAGAPAAVDLPADRPRPAQQTYPAGRVRAGVDRRLTDRLRSLAAEHRVTPFTALFALFQVLIGRLSGVDDLVVACPVAGRPRPEFESLIGLFVTTVPLRGDLSGDPTLRELLRRTGAGTRAAFGHADVPFSRVVEAVRPPRDLSRAPIAQVGFNLLNYPPENLALPGVTSSELPIDPPGALLDLTLHVFEDGPDLRCEAVYNTDLFEHARIEALVDAYLHLIAQADGATPIGALSLVPPAARLVLPDPCAPLSAVTGPTVVDRFRAQVSRTPGVCAVDGSGTSLSYAALDAASDRVAAHLVGAGITTGQVVAVAAARDVRLAVALLGVFKAGAIACLMDPAHPAPRLVAMLTQVAPAAWLAVDDAPLPAGVTAHLRQAPLRLRSTVPELLRSPETELPELPGPALDDPAYALFTSGSTGTPSIVLTGHRALAHFTDWYAAQFVLGALDRFAVASGTAHDPVLRDLVVPLCVGATACLPDPDTHRAPDAMLTWLRHRRITVLHVTPQLARLLTEAATPEQQLPDLRLVGTGGDALTTADAVDLAALAPGADIVSCYGATETPQAVAWQRAGADPDRARVPLGRGIPDVQLLVLNRHGAQAGVGELGEIVVRSPHLALGDLGGDALTAQRFTAPTPGDRRYRTGDLGRYLPDGRVDFAGRRGGQVKVRGHRVELAEVSAVLDRHPQVRHSLVLALPEPDGDCRLVAWVVPGPGTRPHIDDLHRHLCAALPGYAVPSAVVAIGAIPLSPNGKLDRAALPRPPARGRASAAVRPPRTDAERAVVQVWRDVLGIEVVGLDDNFFDLGGTSLHLVKVQRRLVTALRTPVGIVDLFRYPTVRVLVARFSIDLPAPGTAAAAALPTTGFTSAASTVSGGTAARAALRTDLRRARPNRRATTPPMSDRWETP